MKGKISAMTMLMLAAYRAGNHDPFLGMPSIKKSAPPWHYIHIPKKYRKGKTYEEIQTARKEIYEAVMEDKKK
jgi:hypothetical protein